MAVGSGRHPTWASGSAEIDEERGRAAPVVATQRARVEPVECEGCGITFLAVNGRRACMVCRLDIDLEHGEDDEPGGEVEPQMGTGGARQALVRDPDAFRRDLTSGMALEDVADKWGVEPAKVIRWCWNRRIPVPPKRAPATPADAPPAAVDKPVSYQKDGASETETVGAGSVQAVEVDASPAARRRIVWYRPQRPDHDEPWVRVVRDGLSLSQAVVRLLDGAQRVRVGVDPDRREVVLAPSLTGMVLRVRGNRRAVNIVSKRLGTMLRQYGVPGGRLPARWDPALAGIVAGSAGSDEGTQGDDDG